MRHEDNWCELRVALAWIMDKTGRLPLEIDRNLNRVKRTRPELSSSRTNHVPPKYAKAERQAWLKLRDMAAHGHVLLRGEPYIPSIAKQRIFNPITAIAPNLASGFELDNERWNCQLRPRDWQGEDQCWWRDVSVDFRGKLADHASSKEGTSSRNVATTAKPKRAISTPNPRSQVGTSRAKAANLTGKTREAFNLIMDFFAPNGPPKGFGAAKITQRIKDEGTEHQYAIVKGMKESTLKLALDHVRAIVKSE